jgi:hypothetical protein
VSSLLLDRQVATQLRYVPGRLAVVLRATADNMPEPLRAVVGARVSHLDDDKETTRKVWHLAPRGHEQRTNKRRSFQEGAHYRLHPCTGANSVSPLERRRGAK